MKKISKNNIKKVYQMKIIKYIFEAIFIYLFFFNKIIGLNLGRKIFLFYF